LISRFAINIREEYHILNLKTRVGWMVSYSWLMEKYIKNPTQLLCICRCIASEIVKQILLWSMWTHWNNKYFCGPHKNTCNYFGTFDTLGCITMNYINGLFMLWIVFKYFGLCQITRGINHVTKLCFQVSAPLFVCLVTIGYI
jgi:hypothetical protein